MSDLKTSHKISKQQWALKCCETESQKRLFVSTSPFSSKRKAQTSLFSYDKELGVSPLTKTPSKISVPCGRSLLKPLNSLRKICISLPKNG